MASHQASPRAAAKGLLRIALPSLLVASILIGGAGTYLLQRNRERTAVYRALEAHASLIARQVGSWRSERLSDAQFISRSPAVAAAISALAADPGSHSARDEVSSWLEGIKGGDRYEGVMVVDRAGKVLESVGVKPEGPCEDVGGDMAAAEHSGLPILSDILLPPGDEAPHLHMVAPIFAPGTANGAAPMAHVFFRLEPRSHLYPLLKDSTQPGQTAETLMIRREGEEIVYLVDPRDAPGQALRLRRPASDLEVASGVGSGGEPRVVEKRDSRGARVLAVSRPVAGTPWFVVAKISHQEAYAHVRRLGWETGILVGVLTVAVLVGTLLVGRDQRQRESERLYRSMFEQNHAVMLVVDPTTRGIVDANPAASRFYGWTRAELTALRMDQVNLLPAEELMRRIAEARKTGNLRFLFQHRLKDGTVRDVEVFSGPLLMSGRELIFSIVHDITERKSMETQLLQAQRLEAIGTLASGIAHDLNNILAPILLVGGVLRDRAVNDADRQLLSMAYDSARRGADVIRQLLTFSRGQGGEKSLIQLRYVLKELVAMMRETFPRDIELLPELADDLWPLLGDATQLHQVILNLCVNARDAMPRGGRLAFKAANIRIEAGDPRLSSGSQPGPYLAIMVQDTGHGIQPEHLPRIFDPFFTTKAVGKGTGLGLSTAIGLVRAHGGMILVDSIIGHGTTFTVLLPAHAKAETPATTTATGSPFETPVAPKGTILIVDDEAFVVQTMQLVLEQHGHRVLTAANGLEGLTRFLANRHQVRLVLTDMMMPVMGGMALIRALRAIDPAVRILPTTGMIDTTQERELTELGITSVLVKPAEVPVLLAKVHAAAETPVASPPP